ncbi:Short C-terminal domain-containing protein [Micrococcales bacterium KH10]|nr:Short C-terminal domain-containing protein [Micrococcales bacterium KH10]
MTHLTPTFAGWYPDPDAGGTRYWNGSRWTGDTRPARKPFAAAAAHRGWGIALIVFGLLSLVMSPGDLFDPTGDSGLSMFERLGAFFFRGFSGIIAALWGLYLVRGQGPTTKAVQKRVAFADHVQAVAEYTAAPMRSYEPAPLVDPVPTQPQPVVPDGPAAQIDALAKLAELHQSGALNDVEFAAAKGKILGL